MGAGELSGQYSPAERAGAVDRRARRRFAPLPTEIADSGQASTRPLGERGPRPARHGHGYLTIGSEFRLIQLCEGKDTRQSSGNHSRDGRATQFFSIVLHRAPFADQGRKRDPSRHYYLQGVRIANKYTDYN